MTNEETKQSAGKRPTGRPRLFGSKGEKYTHTYTIAVAYRRDEHAIIKKVAEGLNMNTSAFIRMCVRYCLNTPSVCTVLRTLGSIGESGMEIGGKARALSTQGEGNGSDNTLYNTTINAV